MSPYAAAVLTLADGLRAAFPSLTIKVRQDHPEVDLSIDIPRQGGLPFDINLNLQEDELHLSVAGFWRSYHPANQPDVLQWFQETIAGLLSGSHRIVSHYRGRRVVAGEVQRLDAGQWKTVTEGYRIWGLGRKRTEILRASVAPDAVQQAVGAGRHDRVAPKRTRQRRPLNGEPLDG